MAERASFRVMTPRSTSLLPVLAPPRIERVARLSARVADTLDAILVIIPTDASPAVFSALPQAPIWRQLHAGRARPGRRPPPKTAAKAGSGPSNVRSINLANSRQTRLILGVVAGNASAFEILSVAGRMARELGSCTAGSIALVAPTDQAGLQDRMLEALLSATLACAFEMPNFRSVRKRTMRPQQVIVAGLIVALGFVLALFGLVKWITS